MRECARIGPPKGISVGFYWTLCGKVNLMYKKKTKEKLPFERKKYCGK